MNINIIIITNEYIINVFQNNKFFQIIILVYKSILLGVFTSKLKIKVKINYYNLIN